MSPFPIDNEFVLVCAHSQTESDFEVNVSFFVDLPDHGLVGLPEVPVAADVDGGGDLLALDRVPVEVAEIGCA